jgi:hypothetical protein
VEAEAPSFELMQETLKKAAAALRDGGIPFLLVGGLAAWARGGPESSHDLDLAVRPADAERALDTLEGAGFRTEKPPEGWLYKAWDSDILVDVIFEPTGQAIDDGVFERAEELNVASTPMLVMSLEDLFVTKLCALREHELDYDSLVEFARPLREQIDWPAVRKRTESSPYAKAFFTLVEELGIADPA